MKQGRKKSGSFKDGGKAPEFKGGLDWEAIRRCHRPPGAAEPLPEKLQLSLVELDRANRGVQNHYDGKDGQREKKVKDKRVRNPGIGQGKGMVVDVREAVRLYTEENLTPAEVGERMGIKTSTTVIKYLKQAGVYDPNKYRYGSPHSKHKPPVREAATYSRKTECVRGHDMTLPDARYPSGGCRKCKQEDNEKHRQVYSWDEDPRNPKNGGSGNHSEKKMLRQKNRKLAEREACPREGCGHRGDKHLRMGCRIQRCECRLTAAQLTTFWDGVRAIWAAPENMTCEIEGCGKVYIDHSFAETLDHFGVDVP